MAKTAFVSCIWKSRKTEGKVPISRFGTSLAVVSDDIYLFGGSRYENTRTSSFEVTFLNDMHTLSVSNDRLLWRNIAQEGSIPSPREGHSLHSMGKYLFIFGGKDHTYSDECLPGVARFCTKKYIWENLNTTGNSPFAIRHSSAVVDGSIYVFGGLVAGKALNQLHQFNTENNSWHNVEGTGSPPPPRCDHSCAAVNDVIYIFGGMEGVNNWLSDLYCFNTKTKTWSRPILRGVPPSPRCSHSFVCHRDKDIYVLGGWARENTEDVIFADLKKMSIDNQKWKIPITAGEHPPSGRYGHCACIIHSCMYVLGGVEARGESPFSKVYMLQLINPSDRKLVLAHALQDFASNG